MSFPSAREALRIVSPEGERPPIRRASKKDLATFRSLWKGFIIDQSKRGSSIGVSERTTLFYETLFLSYVQDELPGICLIAGMDLGILLWGAPLTPPIVPLRDEPVGMAWGTYVLPASCGTGISRRLRSHAQDLCRQIGFRRMIGSVLVTPEIRDRVLTASPFASAAIESGLGAGFVWEEAQASLYLDREEP